MSFWSLQYRIFRLIISLIEIMNQIKLFIVSSNQLYSIFIVIVKNNITCEKHYNRSKYYNR